MGPKAVIIVGVVLIVLAQIQRVHFHDQFMAPLGRGVQAGAPPWSFSGESHKARGEVVSKEQRKKIIKGLGLVVGIGVFVWLALRLPMVEALETVQEVGWEIGFAFLPAPLWFWAHGECLRQLLGKRISAAQAFYMQLGGYGWNQLLPLAGFGGEPYKLRFLARRQIPTHEASQAVVVDRMLHGLSSPAYTAVVIVAALIVIPLEAKYQAPLALFALASIVAAVISMAFTLSRGPTHFTNFFLKRFKSLETLTKEHDIPRRDLWIALAFKLVGRFLNLFEIWVTVRVLGLDGTPTEVLAVATALALSNMIFFFVTQGLGTHEAMIAGAFEIIGLGSALGLSCGLVRRARLLFWAVIGLAVIPLEKMLWPAAPREVPQD